MREAVIVDMVRTPFGRAGQKGAYRDITHVELVVPLIKAIVERNRLDPTQIDEIIMGSVGIAGVLTRSRHYLFEADMPFSISATDLNKQCGSSLQAVVQGAFSIRCGMSDIVLAGGVETMDRVAPIPPGDERDLQQVQAAEVMTREMLPTSWPGPRQPQWLPRWYQKVEPWIMNMGMTAEKLAQERGITREDSDRFALESHRRAVRAWNEGTFQREVIPIEIAYSDGSRVAVDRDQLPREDTSLEKLAQLKPSFRPDGICTAGNSSPRTDGAAVCLLMSKEKARELGLKPLATVRHAATVGVDPTIMGIGPVPATRKLLERTGMALSDFDLIEINEAFACQVLACGYELGWDWERVNVNGGAIALGHPLGASGARLAGTLAFELARRNLEWGLVTLCMGAGMGMSVALQREEYG
ncbi:Acetyl-CoA acetyltransferase [bacterium HR24]|jgi:acetyl-CoA acetyltransferase family protein|nr:Acetyl-CoA acetyltransferase [bacterium HR24]